MKTLIYYFTGTGNSLTAARKIADALGNCNLVPIASLTDTTGTIVPDAERVGIVCPVYDAGLPLIVAEFAGRLDLSRAQFTFGIVTMGGTGISALHQLKNIFKEHGSTLDAAFAVIMPGNFPPVGSPPAGAKREKILAAADESLTEISALINKGTVVPPGFAPFSRLMRHLLYPPFIKGVHESDKAFSADVTCTSCGTCVNVCPKKNILLENGKPVWQHRCELCCACLHFCPTESIQLTMMRGTKGRGRYHHPDVTITDMKAQRGD